MQHQSFIISRKLCESGTQTGQNGEVLTVPQCLGPLLQDSKAGGRRKTHSLTRLVAGAGCQLEYPLMASPSGLNFLSTW